MDALKPTSFEILGYTPSQNYLQTKSKSWLAIDPNYLNGTYQLSINLIDDLIFKILSIYPSYTSTILVCKHWHSVIKLSLGKNFQIVINTEKERIKVEKEEEKKVHEERYMKECEDRLPYYYNRSAGGYYSG